MNENLLYQFEVNIHRIYVDITLPCSLQVKLKKGKHQSSGRHFKITDNIQFVDINDTIMVKAKGKIKNGQFWPNEARVQVLLYPQQSNEIKVAGDIQKFDLTQALSVDRRRENTQKKFEVPLSKSTKNARMVFTIYARYLNDCQNQESMADISFQGQPNGSFNRSTTDMTFRPQSENRRPSVQKEEYLGDIRSPLMPPKAEMKYDNREQRISSMKQEVRQNRENRDSRREVQKGESRSVHRNQFPPVQKAEQQSLGFSFGPQNIPMNVEKQHDNLLKHFNEINQELILKKQECDRLTTALRQTQNDREGMDQQKLQLLNERNSTVKHTDTLNKQKNELSSQLSKVKEDYRQLQATFSKFKDENKDLINNYNRLREEYSKMSTSIGRDQQEKHQEINQIRSQLEKVVREKQEMKNELFRKQSELIANENGLEEVKAQYLNKSIPIMEELKRVNQDLGKQRADIEKTLEQAKEELNYERHLKEESEKRASSAFEELQRQREKIKNHITAFQSKQTSNKQNLSLIEQQMQNFFAEKDHELKQKDHELKQKEYQIGELNKMLSEQLRQRQEESNKTEFVGREFESNQIQISELKVKIKHLEQAYSNLEKDYDEKHRQVSEKSDFISKVKEYVTKIQADNNQKDTAIKQRDEFIAKAKEFITSREKELLTENEQKSAEVGDRQRNELNMQRNEIERFKVEINNIGIQAGKREAFIAELVSQNNVIEQQVEQAEGMRFQAERRAGELQEYVGQMHEKMQQMQQQMQELSRKSQSQGQTLSDLIKHKLNMQMELNICNFELSKLRCN